MTKRRFGKRLALGAILVAASTVPSLHAQQDQPVAEGANKAGSPIKIGPKSPESSAC